MDTCCVARDHPLHYSTGRGVERLQQLSQAGGDARAKVNANHAPLVRLQRLKIAERLRLFQHAEGIRLVGNRHVGGIGRDEL